jgi:ABC-type sugar transport system ATPase subunit
VTNSTLAESFSGEQPILTLRVISKGFSGVRALPGVNLDVRSGEIDALMGDNAAGK